MNTYRELVYMILDELKMKTDDNSLEVEHIVAILDKYRAAIIRQRFGTTIKRFIPTAYYQLLEIDVDPTTKLSLKQLPNLIDLNSLELSTEITAPNVYNAFKITLVNSARFGFLGYNKFLSSILYATINRDNYLECKYTGTMPSRFYIYGILERPQAILDFNDDPINPLDIPFPLEATSIAELMAMALKEVADVRIFPFRDKNNAKEDELAQARRDDRDRRYRDEN